MNFTSSIFLKPGDSIEFIAPASKFNVAILKAIEQLMEGWGLKALFSCPLSDQEWLFAASDAQRFEALQSALLNPLSKAIWIIWGGYGSARLIPYLLKMKRPSLSKLVMGFSDTTALHLFFNQKWNWTTLHCPSARQAALKLVCPTSLTLLKEWIFGNIQPYILDLVPLNHTASSKGEFLTAPIIGGNLSVVMSSLGTSWQIATQKKLLFLEETGEAAYRIDRMLNQLQQAGLLEEIKGLILGEFIQKQTQKTDEQTQRLLNDWVDRLHVPAYSVKSGHASNNYPIPLNCVAKCHIAPSLRLVFSEF